MILELDPKRIKGIIATPIDVQREVFDTHTHTHTHIRV